MSSHQLPQRVRHALRFRQLQVESKIRVADSFWRIVFTSDGLQGFQSAGFDDHIKLFFPPTAGGAPALPTVGDDGIHWPDGVQPASRDYTPLAFDGERRLTLDFYIHQDGLASDWATQARPGDTLIAGGPRGSLVIPEDYAFQLYVCDESGLPALRRRLATQRAQQVHLYAFVDADVGESYLPATAGLTVHWLGHDAQQPGKVDRLLDALAALPLPEDNYYIWLTGEGGVVKRLSDHFLQQRQCDPRVVRAVAYWHQK
ncbi:siderophore-interacting protein [Pantoea sp. 1.19]|uniref:siderophore-interacting protein n=1 Tax=Pantoea sp. 1.19 TaxID=1925589 RepID=UPI000AB07403|nr:siderophore-interacting protein [Pantoea sp. 1.19]